MCAGITTFNRASKRRARRVTCRDPGLGGLGHLGVQFAAKMGFRTVAVARGAEKGELARKLGAWRYIDSKVSDSAGELKKLGGARVVLATVTTRSDRRAAGRCWRERDVDGARRHPEHDHLDRCRCSAARRSVSGTPARRSTPRTQWPSAP